MKRAGWIVTGALAMSAGITADAGAQGTTENQFFVGVNGGFQSGSSTVLDQSTFIKYGEEGLVDVNYDVTRSGGLFDISGGLMIWQNVGFAVGYSHSSTTTSASVTALTPHPLFFSRSLELTESLNLPYTSAMVHFMAVLRFTLGPQWKLSVSAGPTRLSVDHDVLRSVDLDRELQNVVPPYTTVDSMEFDTKTTSRIGVGFNVGADLSYMLHPNYGPGIFVRYTGGALEFPLIGSDSAFDVGGLQIGGGLRLNF